ncbi:hypothetical protein WI61_38685 [Burkholderia cepacia]|uniref:GlcG/HbpS family heme-binding protein n=1 Tax=Burkholderia cepacia TaxID=292 RepID=UPI00075A76AD|nr:heme-binding protein [Burkholderia cepacia]KVA59758.1 hypothetical protein WI47_34445 [Burkholderia cepacia]KVA64610.1 hypothetical protein WI49_17445 [Burkholderia cepacia]KVA64793.1 hypothetical protein WI48_05790 [Burkholderia cepacia]KVA82907.1 hypothetical protein WI51_24400 [Burkholderia cepacia]KVA86693.1 hypothetical protein WI50_14990 [Burkholderia cepacia]
MTITLLNANLIINEAFACARAQHAAPLAVVILDSGGHLKAAAREDGAGFLRTEIAFAKAWGALGMGQSSRQLAARAEQQTVFFSSLLPIAQGRMALSAGGILCFNEDGTLAGAVGISGDTADVDEKCALAALAMADLRPERPSGA